MLVADLDFITTDSAEVYDTIISGLENGVAEPLYPGDERRIFGEALVPLIVAVYNAVNDAARQKMLRYARGKVLDALGERAGVERQDVVPATTTLSFSLSAAIGENIIIPAGTRATGDNTRYFATDMTVVLAAGSTSVTVAATSVGGGTEYNNIAIGLINTIVDLIPYVDAVTNTTVTSGGSDEESDDSLRERIRLAPSQTSTAGPINAYKYWAKSADPTISDVNVSSPSAGTVKIVPILYGGIIPDAAILAKVLAACSASDVRPLTDNVTVEAPTTVSYDIELKYYTTAAEESQCIDTIEGSGGAIDQFVLWQDSALGRSINPDKLRALILAPSWADGLTAATRVDVIKPVFTELDPTVVAKHSGTLTVTHEVVT